MCGTTGLGNSVGGHMLQNEDQGQVKTTSTLVSTGVVFNSEFWSYFSGFPFRSAVTANPTPFYRDG